jgi:hypothetical protein
MAGWPEELRRYGERVLKTANTFVDLLAHAIPGAAKAAIAD